MNTPEKQPTITEIARIWLEAFEQCVRHKRYSAARKLFHKNAMAFGINSDFTADLDEMEAKEWREVWPEQVGFTFDLKGAKMVPDNSLIAICIPWVAGAILHGAPQKRGVSTVILGRFERGKVLCLHLHISKNHKVAIV